MVTFQDIPALKPTGLNIRSGILFVKQLSTVYKTEVHGQDTHTVVLFNDAEDP
jgi:hypothetical protein